MKTQTETKIDMEAVDTLIGREAVTHLYQTEKRRQHWGVFLEVLGALLFALFVAIMLLGALGCSTNRTAYNTLAATQQAGKLSYDGYVDSILSGQTSTNDLPIVSQAFNTFESVMRVSIDAASGNTNAPATPEASAALSKLITTVSNSKGKK
jgi:hypothetical protein